MDELKQRIQNYWCCRSQEFAKLRREELESSMADCWEEELQQLLPKEKPLKILDVGTGSGFFAVLLTGMGHQVTGIDLSEKMIQEGKRLAGEMQIPISFAVMDGEQPDFPDHSFDVVVSRNLTWTLEHPKDAYQNWLRILKPGGLLINFDANYGKETYAKEEEETQVSEKEWKYKNAHGFVDQELLKECDRISRLLPLSTCQRPQWDIQTLEDLGAKEICCDQTISRRIYREENQQYNPVPMFRITAKK